MFRGARHSDLEQILDIYARARKVMAASGNPTQWGDGYPPREMLEEDIDANRAKRAADAAKEELLQKKSLQEYKSAQANLARALSRLRVKERWNGGR